MKGIIVMSVAMLSLAGCATVNHQPISQEAKGALRGQSIVYTTREKTDFAALTPAKAAFGLLGVPATISEGNSLVTKNNIADPADTIAQGLIAALKNTSGIVPVAASVKVDTDDVSKIVEAAHGQATYVLDAQTINWSFGYFPVNWSHYRVIYTAKVRLIDTRTKSVVAEGFCKRIPSSDVDAPTYDELVDNEAAGLKRELGFAAQECIKTMSGDILAI